MAEKIAIIYNEPIVGKYHSIGEGIAIDDVLASVTSVGKALNKLGYEYTCISLYSPKELLEKELSKINADIIFNLFEGFDGDAGSEAAAANMLERLGVCFTGSSSMALRVCEDKNIAKQVLKSCGIPTPTWQVLSPTTCNRFALSFPCIVKPLGEHASHGLSEKSVVLNINDLEERVSYIWQVYERLSLVEKFLPGREFRVLIVGNECPMLYPVEEIVYTLPDDKPRLLTYAAKWVIGHEYYNSSNETCPAKIVPELRQTIETMALESYKALHCHGYATVDLRQDSDEQIMVIDVNPNTDIYAWGGVQLPLEVAGVDYSDFIDQILGLARNQFAKRQSLDLHKSTIIPSSSFHLS